MKFAIVLSVILNIYLGVCLYYNNIDQMTQIRYAFFEGKVRGIRETAKIYENAGCYPEDGK